MNILFVVPYTPSPIRTRPYNLIRSLSRRGHSITLATLWNSQDEFQAVNHILKDCAQVIVHRMPRWLSLYNCLVALPTRKPLQSVYSWQPTLASALDFILSDEKQNFDLVHIEHLRGARYGLFIRSRQAPKGRLSQPPIIWDSVDSISYLFRQAAKKSASKFSRLITQIELDRTERFEAFLPKVFDRTLVTSPIDQQAFLSLLTHNAENSTISILPNGVDLEHFKPWEGEREPATLVLSGKMSYHANISMVWFHISEVMPLVWLKHPDVKLWIVGKDPPKEIQALARDPRITVTGAVDDVKPYLQKATLAAAPVLYGAGIQNKVLEAMACATPVVATPMAVAAINAASGEHVMLAQEPGQIAETIINLLEHPDMRHRIGLNGRSFVEEHHSWDKVACLLEGIYFEVKHHRTQSLNGGSKHHEELD